MLSAGVANAAEPELVTRQDPALGGQPADDGGMGRSSDGRWVSLNDDVNGVPQGFIRRLPRGPRAG